MLMTGGKEYLKIDIQKLCPTVYDEINKENIAKGKLLDEFFCINYENDGLQYYSKWCMDETILKAISRYFKDDVIYVSSIYSRFAYAYSYFIKNGEMCLRDGTFIEHCLCRVNPNLIEEYPNGDYKVSLPIGDDNDKWGIFTITRNNIEFFQEPYNQQILLDENVLVHFNNKDKMYTAKELADAYYESKDTYRNQMNEPVYLENFDMLYCDKRTDKYTGNTYYIVHIPCSQEISEGESISIVVSEYDITHPVNKSLCNICLGVVGKERSVQIVKDNKYTRIRMKPLDIVNHYKETPEA